MKKYNAGGMARAMPSQAKGVPNRGAAAAGRSMPTQAQGAPPRGPMAMKQGGKVKMNAGGLATAGARVPAQAATGMSNAAAGVARRMNAGGLANAASRVPAQASTGMSNAAAGVARRPMKEGGIVMRGKGAATKGYKARGPMG